jgi:hypothetical protein
MQCCNASQACSKACSLLCCCSTACALSSQSCLHSLASLQLGLQCSHGLMRQPQLVCSLLHMLRHACWGTAVCPEGTTSRATCIARLLLLWLLWLLLRH